MSACTGSLAHDLRRDIASSNTAGLFWSGATVLLRFILGVSCALLLGRDGWLLTDCAGEGKDDWLLTDCDGDGTDDWLPADCIGDGTAEWLPADCDGDGTDV